MRDFIRAFAHPFTYNPFRNFHILFGIAWGIPVPIFSLVVHLYAMGLEWSFIHLTEVIRQHPIHWFFLLHPIFFGLVFGAFGTLRKLQDQRLAAVERRRIEREIELAREVQEQLLPLQVPRMKTLDYQGYCRAVHGIGGDYYDFLRLSEDRLFLALGDISGKGISAALLMASLHALFRSRLSFETGSLSEALTDINRIMCAITDSNRFASVVCALYHESTRSLSYVNAGHHPPFLLRSGSAAETNRPSTIVPEAGESIVTTRIEAPNPSLIRLAPTGMVLGLFEEAVIQEESVTLQPGDTLLIYSDGVVEAVNRYQEEFGEDRLLEVLIAHGTNSAEALIQAVLHAVDVFVADAYPHDDVSIIAARVL